MHSISSMLKEEMRRYNFGIIFYAKSCLDIMVTEE